jgi:DNA primase
MFYSPEILERVRQSVDIVDFIGQYVVLKKAGLYYKGLSPFNKEKSPSFMVSPSRQSFKCYSSGHGGDIFKFLMLYENLEFPEAVRRVAEKAGIVLEEDRGGADVQKAKAARSLKETLLRLHSQLASYWRDILKNDPRTTQARDYLKSRKIPESWIQDFCLGYAPDDVWDDTVKWGKKSGFTEQQLIEAGVVIRNESNRVFDRFRGRLMFPICNDQGQIIAFSGRQLKEAENSPKYMNSPETILFKKSKTLFGLDRAKRAILDANQAVICEGQLDVLRCHSAGVLNVIAPLGTAFTEEHARVLHRLAERLVLCLDADRAGQNTTERLGQMLLSAQEKDLKVLAQMDLGLYVVRLPEGHDPDSFINEKGGDAFRKLLEHPMEYLDFYIEHLLSRDNASSVAGRRKIVESVAQLLGLVENAVAREHLVLEAAVKLELSEKALLEEIERIRKKKLSTIQPRANDADEIKPTAKASVARVHPLLQELILLMLVEAGMIAETQRLIDPHWWQDLEGCEIIEKIVLITNEEGLNDVAGLYPHLSPEEQNWIAGLDFEQLSGVGEDVKLQSLQRLARKLNLDWINRQMLILAQKLKTPGLSQERQAEIVVQQTKLQQERRQLDKQNQT